MPSIHYHATLERDLNELREQIHQMSELVIQALRDALQALVQRDRSLAYRVILGDNRIDALEGVVDRLCQEFLVRHMPAGGPLRFVISAIKVNSELERLGDYADAIAHRVVALHGPEPVPAMDQLPQMFERAIAVLREAIDAFLKGDLALAQAAMAMEGEVDLLNSSIFEQLSHTDGQENDLTRRFAVLAILNRLERVADRAVNIAEDATWVIKGEVRRHNPRQGYRVLFISPADATLGPMAEAIARSKAPLQLSFHSVGIEPKPLNPQMVAFMARRGFEVHRPRPRSIADAGTLDDYYVVVTLSKEAEEHCPPLPYRTVQLYWEMPDPSTLSGEEAETAYELIFKELDVKIDDLISAISGTTNEEK